MKTTTARQTAWPDPTEPSDRALEVVVIGSYRRDLSKLRQDYEELAAAGCAVLSPQTTDFVDIKNGFAIGAGEENDAPQAIELRHLAKMQRADFAWLHAPEAYVGPSGAMEIGFAHATGLPVFSRNLPEDVTLREFVHVVASPASAIERMRAPLAQPPSTSLKVLQHYYVKVAHERGYEKEDARDCMLLLTEEVGELARAVRKSIGLQRDGGYVDVDVARELADVQLYLLHFANILKLDLGEAISHKEAENARRFLAKSPDFGTRKFAPAPEPERWQAVADHAAMTK